MGSGHCGPRCRRIHPGGRGGAGTGSGGCHPASHPVSPAHPGNWVLPGKAQVPPAPGLPPTTFKVTHVFPQPAGCTGSSSAALLDLRQPQPLGPPLLGCLPLPLPRLLTPPPPGLSPTLPPWGSVSAAWIPPNNLLTAGAGLSRLSPALGSLLPEVRFLPPSEFSNSSSAQSLPTLSATAANHCHYGSL